MRAKRADFFKFILFTYFQFNGKSYKQKFATPIGSVISPMLAEIVMEDLKEFVFEKSDFDLPFYFRYVDDNIIFHVLLYTNFKLLWIPSIISNWYRKCT